MKPRMCIYIYVITTWQVDHSSSRRMIDAVKPLNIAEEEVVAGQQPPVHLVRGGLAGLVHQVTEEDRGGGAVECQGPPGPLEFRTRNTDVKYP